MNMRKIIVLLLVFVFVLGTVPGFAAQKGASAKAYEQASDEAVFHRVGDWFATRGKSAEEAKAIRADRKAERALKRAQKEAAKTKKALEKEMKKAQQQKRKGFGKK